MQKNLIVLIGGGHAAGKRTTAELIKTEVENLPENNGSSLHIEVLDMTTFEQSVTKNGSTSDEMSKHKFRPARVDFEALLDHLKSLLIHKEGEIQKLLIVHGCYALYNKEICDMSHMRVYIDSDADTRLIRWIRRDVLFTETETLEHILSTYLQGAKQEMTDYIFPTKERADVIMPRGAEANGVSLIVDGILPHTGFGKLLEHSGTSCLRPFQGERFDNQKGNFYELN